MSKSARGWWTIYREQEPARQAERESQGQQQAQQERLLGQQAQRPEAASPEQAQLSPGQAGEQVPPAGRAPHPQRVDLPQEQQSQQQVQPSQAEQVQPQQGQQPQEVQGPAGGIPSQAAELPQGAGGSQQEPLQEPSQEPLQGPQGSLQGQQGGGLPSQEPQESAGGSSPQAEEAQQAEPSQQQTQQTQSEPSAGGLPQTEAERLREQEERLERLRKATGYRDMVEALKPEELSPEAMERERRRAKANAVVSAVGDGISSLANLYFTTKGAQSAPQGPLLSERNQQRYEQYLAKRDRMQEAYLQRLEQAGFADLAQA